MGLEGHATTRIKACAPRAVEGGLTNSFMYVTGWRVGGRAEYRLDVQTPGEYEATLEWMGETPRDTVFTIGAPAGGGLLRIDPGGRVTPTRVNLPSGPAVLAIELECAGDGGEAAQARMRAIVLRRR